MKPGLNHDYACFATHAGEIDDETYTHCGSRSSSSSRSVSRRAMTVISPLSATTRGLRRLFAEFRSIRVVDHAS
jgi:hypothetical protein